MNQPASFAPHSRGPTDHDVRTQIVDAATEFFTHYGYQKTTVSDLAKAIGFSKAYIYKFFDSKQAIGEVICGNRLKMMTEAVDQAVSGVPSAAERFRRMFKVVVETGTALFFENRKLYDIAATAASEGWPACRAYDAHATERITQILRDGRELGEFERKTPLDEAANAIYLVMRPYLNPLLLQYNLDGAETAAAQLSSLVLRSLTP
jgi:AcrR family transcriptional regulator